MRTRLDSVLDVMGVPAVGDVTTAIVPTLGSVVSSTVECDVLVVGGGTGGLVAAWSAASQGRTVCLLEETDWLGGQMTSQGVSALDEHDYIEEFGGTTSYYAFREAIRSYYSPSLSERGGGTPINPGNCWVSRVSFEPHVAHRLLVEMIEPQIAQGRLRVLLRHKAFAVEVVGDRIAEVVAIELDERKSTAFRPAFVLDATELGEILALSAANFSVGAEPQSQTGEPHAQPDTAKAHCVQSLTYTFGMCHAVDRVSNLTHPPNYERNRDEQPYSLRIYVHGGEIYAEDSGWLEYEVLGTGPGTKGSLWEYRRLVDASRFGSGYQHDISMLNWPSMDFYSERSVLDDDPVIAAAALQAAKQLSLGFAYWLRTEAEGSGFPQLHLEPSVMRSTDGLSKFPYVREGRRLIAKTVVTEQDVSAVYQSGPRARHFDDSVGLGWYPIDIHKAGADDVGVSTRTRPFQIPLGALISDFPANLIAAAKNIGVTHITNGCYRLHPVEWNIGEAAGLLASFCLDRGIQPQSVLDKKAVLRAFQTLLLKEGVPLYWLISSPPRSDDLFVGSQILGMTRLLEDSTSEGLVLDMDDSVSGLDTSALAARLVEWGVAGLRTDGSTQSWRSLSLELARTLPTAT